MFGYLVGVFGDGGVPYQFQYGSNGRPTGTGAVTGCVNPFCIGGDLSGSVGSGTNLAMNFKRQVAYTRVSYDLDPDGFPPEAIARVEREGFDVVASDGRFLDVLQRVRRVRRSRSGGGHGCGSGWRRWRSSCLLTSPAPATWIGASR